MNKIAMIYYQGVSILNSSNCDAKEEYILVDCHLNREKMDEMRLWQKKQC